MIKKIESMVEFNELLEKMTPFVVDFYADWCGPCKTIAPKIQELSVTYADIQFVKIDVDDNDNCGEELASKYNVTAMPTFLFFSKGQQVDSVIGANIEKVQEALEKLKKSL